MTETDAPDPIPEDLDDAPTPSLPYSAVHRIPGSASSMSEVSPDDFPGLLSFHSLSRDGADSRVVSYWKSEGHYSASARPFAAALGGAAPDLSGYVTATSRASRSRWRQPMTWYTVVLHVAALVGAFEAVERAAYWLAGKPSVSLTLEETEPLNVLGGSPFQFRAKVSSTAPARTEVRVSDVSWTQPDGSPVPGAELTWSPSTPMTLRTGDETTLTLTGRSPPPGHYELTVSLESQAGRLRDSTPLTRSYDAPSWPALDWSEVTVHKTTQGRCSLKSSLLVGSSDISSLRGEAVLLRRPGVELVGVQFPGTTTSRSSHTDTAGRESSTVLWAVTEVKPFEEVPFYIFLEGPDDTDCDLVARELQLRFHP